MRRMAHASLDSSLPRISVVVVSINEGVSLQRTVENLAATLPDDAELVVVDDGSDDGSADFVTYSPYQIQLFRTGGAGVAGARNFGARCTTGKVIVFADAHIEVPQGWWAPLLHAVEDQAVGAAAPAIAVADDRDRMGFGLRFDAPDLEIEWLDKRCQAPYDVPILPGCCLAMRRDVFDATGGFDDGLIRSGGVDNELAVRFWLLGYHLRIVPEVIVFHLFRDRHPYSISWRTVVHNKLRLALLHFHEERLARVTAALREWHGFAEGLALALAGDVDLRRRQLLAQRIHDDTWLFETFGMSW